MTPHGEFQTISGLLVSQPERKLSTLRAGIIGEMNRLSLELKLVDDALARKRSRTPHEAFKAASAARNGTGAVPGVATQSEGLPRSDILAVVAEMGRPVRPTDVRTELERLGVVRRVQAIRNALIRLENDGLLHRSEDRRFFVVSQNGSPTKNRD